MPDDLVQAVIEREGVVGASMDMWMRYKGGAPDWGTDKWPNNRKYFARSEVTLEDLVNQTDYVCQMAGDARHAGIAGDTDGQSGRECAPADVDTIYA